MTAKKKCVGPSPTPAREAHNTTPEQCMALVPSGFVCPGCGGTLEPIDTVDNAGTPTYWAGCNVCHKFSWGVSAETFDMARWLVDERKENFYHDLDASRESQIRGWTGIAGEIIRRTLSTRETEIAEVEKMNTVLREQNTELSAHNLTQAAELAKVTQERDALREDIKRVKMVSYYPMGDGERSTTATDKLKAIQQIVSPHS